MITPEYHIKSIEADIEPEMEDRTTTDLAIQFQINDAYIDDENENWVNFDLALNIELFEYEKDEFGDDPDYGKISTEFTARINTNEAEPDFQEKIEEEIDRWDDVEYEQIDKELRTAIESEIVPQIFGPLDQLFRASFSGILPRVRFSSQTPVEDE